MKIALIVPHMFMHKDILPEVIFSPGELALQLAEGLQDIGVDVELFTPGPVSTKVKNSVSDMSGLTMELESRGYDLSELMKKHPLTFISLARQIQARMISDVYERANKGEFDLVHVYTNEEELGVIFAKLCQKPVVFTHHDPFNYTTRYRTIYPQYKHLNWLSISIAQRKDMPKDTNWIGNVHHGLNAERFSTTKKPTGDYIAYLGRIIEPKGVHLAISAAKQAGIKLKIAGKHYSGSSKDKYWRTVIEPQLSEGSCEYVGYLKTDEEIESFLGNARALIVPSTWNEPFGMVLIEALACGTPVIGLKNGAIGEIIVDGENGKLIEEGSTETITIDRLAQAIASSRDIPHKQCRESFWDKFTLEKMIQGHAEVYKKLISAKDTTA